MHIHIPSLHFFHLMYWVHIYNANISLLTVSKINAYGCCFVFVYNSRSMEVMVFLFTIQCLWKVFYLFVFNSRHMEVIISLFTKSNSLVVFYSHGRSSIFHPPPL